MLVFVYFLFQGFEMGLPSQNFPQIKFALLCFVSHDFPLPPYLKAYRQYLYILT